MARNITKRLHAFGKSIWLFPVLLSIPLVVFTGLKISGSSVGMYDSILYGDNHEDPNLLYGHPRGIRSDEWLVNTQLIAAQESNDYERINTNIGYGQDASLSGDAPYKEWSVIFRPHNLAFFVLPFENAFAFKWWFMAYMVMVSCYLFVLTLLKGKRLLASLFAVALFCSPFVQWWYAYGTLGSLYFALFIAVVLTKIVQAKRTRSRILWSGLLAYLLVSLALVLYPPYQIPCALAAGIFFLGYLLETYSSIRRAGILKALLYVAGASAVAGLVILIFLKTRADAIEIMANTVYPGKRESVSGGLNSLHIFGNQLSPLLQSDRLGANYYINQSEASGFIFVFPFLFLLSAYLLVRRWLAAKEIDWLLLVVNLALAVLLARVFLPGFNIFYKPFLLHFVPPERLMIGVGLLAFMQIMLLIRHWQNFKPKLNIWIVGLSTVATFAVFYYSGNFVLKTYPIFLNDSFLVIAAALAMTAIVFLICIYRFTLALVVLVAFSILSVYRVNPLYRGMGALLHSTIANSIEATAKNDDGAWLVTDSLINENLPTVGGAKSFAGVQLYPQLAFWREADPQRKHEHTYNRYAHVSYVLNDSSAVTFQLMGLDNFQVSIDPCGNFAAEHDIDFILAAQPAKNSCLKLIDFIEYPVAHFYIYEIQEP